MLIWDEKQRADDTLSTYLVIKLDCKKVGG